MPGRPLVAIVAALGLFAAAAADDPPAKSADGPKAEAEKQKDEAEAKKPKRRVDRSYQPRPGDRAELHSEDEKGETFDIWVAANADVFREYVKALSMEAGEVNDRLEADGRVLIVDDETRGQVLAVEPVVFPLGGNKFVDEVAVSVRVLDGPHKGKTFLTAGDHVVRFRPAPGERKAKNSAAAKKGTTPTPAPAADPAARAASLLGLGQRLEKAGKTAGALDFYRRIVKDFPDTPVARTAAGRIEALEK